MRLFVATRSKGKQREIRQIFDGSGIDVVFPSDLGLYHEPDEDRLESGATCETNARAKAEYFARRTGVATAADDSGLEVIALGGEPGVRSRRWAAATGTAAEIDAANNAYLLKRLLGAPPRRRRARYRCVVAYVPGPRMVPMVYEGICHGEILTEPRGENGFGYDPLFLSDDLHMTFGEADTVDKHRVSHRGLAFAALRKALVE